MTFCLQYGIVKVQSGILATSSAASARKETAMEEMALVEEFREVVEENQIRKILAILEASNDLEEAKEKVRALLTK